MKQTPRSSSPGIRQDLKTFVEHELRRALAQGTKKKPKVLRDMLEYHLGFPKKLQNKISNISNGKRLRAMVCLLISEGYGNRDNALNAALAIEFFHHFTLIHDDIEDGDAMRRGRPTLWKKWGVPRAINAGDALSLIACQHAYRAGGEIGELLLSAFSEVIDGQQLDFEISEAPLVTSESLESRYVDMIVKKTGALFGAAAEAAGVSNRQSQSECAHLRAFGRALGLVFQMKDDYISVWHTSAKTGKDTHSDIREHKRTLPVLIAYRLSMHKRDFSKLYARDRQLATDEIAHVRLLIDETAARGVVEKRMFDELLHARRALDDLSIRPACRAALSEIVDSIIPNI